MMRQDRPSPTVAAAILAGGEGRRMGHAAKGELTFRGERFLDRIARQLSGYPERLLSLRTLENAPECGGFTPVADRFYDCGAISGIYTSLSACRADYLQVVGCDMPLFTAGLGQYLSLFLCPDYDVFLPLDRAGREHPLCGIYSKRALPVLERRLRERDFRLMAALGELRVKRIPLYHSIYPDECLTNINTPEDLQRLVEEAPELLSRIPAPPPGAVLL